MVKVHVGAHVDGYIGDTAATVEVGTKNWTDLIGASARALTFATEMINEAHRSTRSEERSNAA